MKMFNKNSGGTVGNGEVSLNLVTLTKLNEMTHPPFEGQQTSNELAGEILTFFEFQHVNPPLTVPRRLLF